MEHSSYELNVGKVQRLYTVYVADDDPIASRIVRRLVESIGDGPVLVFQDGASLWEALSKERHPHLVLLDSNMPGINGLEIVERLRAREESRLCYIVMITVEAAIEHTARAFELGVDDVLVKPLNAFNFRCRLHAGHRLLTREVELEVDRRALAMRSGEMEKLAQDRAEQLVRSDRMATLGVMSAGIAHEINNPTCMISGNAQTLETMWPFIEKSVRSTLEGTPENRAQLEMVASEGPKLIAGIRNGVKRISRIVDGLRTYAHQRDDRRVPCTVTQIVEESIELSRSALKQVSRIESSIPADLPLIEADRLQIEQVLLNLFQNATHAMEGREDSTLRVTASADDRTVILDIDDNGPGIPETHLRKIWLPFFTTKEVGKGTGLGLHICKDIINNHHGEIQALNRPEGGARFRIRFPRADREGERES